MTRASGDHVEVEQRDPATGLLTGARILVRPGGRLYPPALDFASGPSIVKGIYLGGNCLGISPTLGVPYPVLVGRGSYNGG
jgi:hypothetical protein